MLQVTQKKRLSNIKSYVQFSDSIATAEREMPGSDFNKTFDRLNQEDQITLLKKEKTAADRFLIVALALSVMAVIIIFLVWNNYNQSKKGLQKQTALNNQISTHNATIQKTLNALEAEPTE